MNKITYKCKKCGEEREETIVKMDLATAFAFIIGFFSTGFFGLYCGLTIVEKIQTESNWLIIGILSIVGIFYCGILIEKFNKRLNKLKK